MKSSVFIAAFSASLLIYCSPCPAQPGFWTSLQGQWEWTQSRNYLTGELVTPHSVAYARQWVFGPYPEPAAFREFHDELLVLESTYHCDAEAWTTYPGGSIFWRNNVWISAESGGRWYEVTALESGMMRLRTGFWELTFFRRGPVHSNGKTWGQVKNLFR